jgi:hypothetical protein
VNFVKKITFLLLFEYRGGIKGINFKGIKFKMMNWLWFSPLLLLLLAVSIFQCVRSLDSKWWVFEISVVIQSEDSDPSKEELEFTGLSFDSNSLSSFFNQTKFIFQLKTPSSFLFSFFQGTFPFWRPPPVFCTYQFK